MRQVLLALLRLAGAVLKAGGTLVSWLPFATDWLDSEPVGKPACLLPCHPASHTCPNHELERPCHLAGDCGISQVDMGVCGSMLAESEQCFRQVDVGLQGRPRGGRCSSGWGSMGRARGCSCAA